MVVCGGMKRVGLVVRRLAAMKAANLLLQPSEKVANTAFGAADIASVWQFNKGLAWQWG